MTSNQRRVSCAGLCRIKNSRGDYLLSLNRSQLEKKQVLLTPVGGVFRYFSQMLLPRFGAIPEAEYELRLFLPEDQLDSFQAWFTERHEQEREVTPFRELHEELVDELKVLPPFNETQVNMRYRHLSIIERFSNRPNATGILTTNFAEIFDVIFLEHNFIDILENISPASRLYWVAEQDIERGRNAQDIRIAAKNLFGESFLR